MIKFLILYCLTTNIHNAKNFIKLKETGYMPVLFFGFFQKIRIPLKLSFSDTVGLDKILK